MVANASGTVTSAGWATTAPGASRPGPAPSITASTAETEASAADGHPGDRPRGGQPAPPDPEEQQRAERGGGHREGQLHGVGHGQPGARATVSTRVASAATTPASRKAVTGSNHRPSRSWPSTPPTETTRPEEVERNAANAPAHSSAVSRSPPMPPRIRCGQLEHDRVGAARWPPGRGRRPGRARRTAWGAGRRRRASPARAASYAGPRGRRGWCRSAPPRGAAPSCRGTSPGSASRRGRSRAGRCIGSTQSTACEAGRRRGVAVPPPQRGRPAAPAARPASASTGRPARW